MIICKNVRGVRMKVWLMIVLISFVFSLTSCLEEEDAATGDDTTSGGAEVTFIFPINPQYFTEEAVLTVRIFNGVQLAISDRQANCTVSYNMETETISCPDGIDYQEVEPEEISFTLSSTTTEITVVSDSVGVGEEYRLQASALSSDECNGSSASSEGTVTSGVMNLGDLSWMTTQMACNVGPPPGHGNDDEFVTFMVPVDSDMFEQGVTLTVRVYDGVLMEFSDLQADCTVGYDTQTQQETYSCPGGREYQHVLPEEHLLQLTTNTRTLTIQSEIVTVGEEYRLRITGTSNDGCNTTSTAYEGVAEEGAVTLPEQGWGTTEMACVY